LTAVVTEEAAVGRVPEKPGAPSWPAWAVRAAWGIIAFGAVLRVCRWLAGRSLWMDELYLAKSVADLHHYPTIHDLLFRELEYWQAAPAGFLILTRWSVLLFGAGERALRAPSLLMGLIALPLFLAVAKRILPPRGGLVAVALFSVLTPLIYYSQELKQYSDDIVVALAVTLAALWRMEKPEDPRRLVMLALAGIVGAFFSQPAVFVLAGVGCALVLQDHFAGRRRASAQAALVAAAWALAFGVNWWLFIRPISQRPKQYEGLIRYWINQDGFMPHWWFGAYGLPAWIWTAFWKVFAAPGAMWMYYAGVAMLIAIVGFAALWRSDRNRLVILTAPILFVLAASYARKYPFGDRLVLFIVPALILLLGAGVDYLWRHGGPARNVVALVAVGMLVIPSAGRSISLLVRPVGREESGLVYRYIGQHWRPGDVLYLYHNADVSFDHYKDEAGLGKVKPIIQPNYSGDFRGFIEDLNQLKGKPRVWVVFTHVWTEHGLDEMNFTLVALDRVGLRQDRYPNTDAVWDYGAQCFLYDMTAAPAPIVKSD